MNKGDIVMKIINIFVIVALFIGCTGSRAWYGMKMGQTAEEAEINNQKIMKLKIGQSKEEVLKIMGPPTKREAYKLENKKIVEFLFYRTQGWAPDGLGDRDSQFTPVAIVNTELVGWGRNYYDNVVRAAVEVIIR
jgi:hypothetical protein